ncbi:MAG: hypothetical protein HYZ90_04050 [Candidatus Omnitrophica bacterium]|nr:hypothetical protein [Candidatus Omnitrophota bacterium]
MIVVAVVALLVAIAIPNLLRARHNANESTAVEAMRAFSTALESFRAAQTPPTYPVVARSLSAANPTYLPASLTSATTPGTARQGYYFTYTFISADSYAVQAAPAAAGTTGSRRFYVDETGVIRANPAAPAGPTDPEIQ